MQDTNRSGLYGVVRALQMQRNEALDKLADRTAECDLLRKELQESQGREMKLRKDLEAFGPKNPVPKPDEADSTPELMQ